MATKPTTAPTNGTSNTSSNLTAVAPVKAEKKELPTIAPEKRNDANEQKPLEDRIFRVQQLSDLVSRREKLQDSLKKLNSFKLSSDSRLDSLTIEDGEGHEFSTSNTAAIADVIQCLKASIQKKLQEVEALIIL